MKSRAKQAALDAIDALRRILRPVLAIQAAAILLVVAFYLSPAVQEFSGGLAKWSAAGGVWGAALSTLVASIVIPRVFQVIVRWKGENATGRDLVFEIGYWAFVGIEIYLFYELQSMIFGDAPRFSVVASKVAFDMLVFTPLWNMPLSSVLFLWRDRGYSIAETRKAIRDGDLVPRLAVFIVGAAGYWLPMVSAIYSLPHDVQFCLFLLAQAAWTLILLAMDRGKRSLAPS